MKSHLFDYEEPKEKKHYTVGQWIFAVIILAVLAGLVLFTLATWIKFALEIWGII
jgi:type IV secretory pathway TrbD component